MPWSVRFLSVSTFRLEQFWTILKYCKIIIFSLSTIFVWISWDLWNMKSYVNESRFQVLYMCMVFWNLSLKVPTYNCLFEGAHKSSCSQQWMNDSIVSGCLQMLVYSAYGWNKIFWVSLFFMMGLVLCVSVLKCAQLVHAV